MSSTANDCVTKGLDSPVGSQGVARDNAVDRWNPKLVSGLTVAGFALPVIGYLWLVAHFSVNVLVGDDWDQVPVIQQSYAHFLDWGQLWAQHNENRIFFPNLIVVLVAHSRHYDMRVVEYLGAAMLLAATACILVAHKRRSPSIPWVYYCPVAFLMLSFVQEGNTLWGFQLAWFLVLLCLAAVLLILDRGHLTWLALGGAAAVAVVGSFSSLQGLLIWPAALVLCYYRRWSRPHLGAWIAAGVATTAFYLHNYDSAASPLPRFALQHPQIAIKFFFFLIGDVVGKPVALGSSDPANSLVVLFGVVVFILAVGTVIICSFRSDRDSGSPIGIALIVYGLLFAAFVTQGRSYYGYGGASFSRYTTFDLLILAGIFLALLGRRSLWRGAPAVETDPTVPPEETTQRSKVGSSHGGIRSVAYRAAAIVLVVAVMLQIPLGFHNGLRGAESFHVSQIKAAETLRNIDHVSNSQLGVAEFFVSPQMIRRRAQVLKEHRLSVFDQ